MNSELPNLNQLNLPDYVTKIRDEKEPEIQAQMITKLVDSIRSGISKSKDIKEFSSACNLVLDNHELFSKLWELGDLINDLRLDFDVSADDLNYLSVLESNEEFRIEISKYELHFKLKDAFTNFNKHLTDLLQLEFLDNKIKEDIKGVLKVLIEFIPGDINENNWYKLFTEHIESIPKIENKIIRMREVLVYLGKSLERVLSGDNYHPHIPKIPLLRTNDPEEYHMGIVREAHARPSNLDIGVVNSDEYSMFYSDINVGTSLILELEAFIRVLKSAHTKILDNGFLSNIERGLKVVAPETPWQTKLTLRGFDLDSLENISTGLMFTADREDTRICDRFRLGIKIKYSVSNRTIKFDKVYFVTAFPI